MRVKPADIARALVDQAEADPASVDAACAVALDYLRKTSPGCAKRHFLKLVEREMRRRGEQASGLLIVPNARTVNAMHIGALVSASSGKQNMRIDERIEPDVIGGAVLLIEHRRIDCSVQGALRELLQTCLEPLE